MSWAAASHDVYFGTSSNPAAQGNQIGVTFDPGTLQTNTTYYWRVDEVNGEGTSQGNLWSFTTEAQPGPPGQATNPAPAADAPGVPVDVVLSWTAGSAAASHDVYFGTSSNPGVGEFKGNQIGVTFNPGTLQTDTTYYWRVDELNGQGTPPREASGASPRRRRRRPTCGDGSRGQLQPW